MKGKCIHASIASRTSCVPELHIAPVPPSCEPKVDTAHVTHHIYQKWVLHMHLHHVYQRLALRMGLHHVYRKWVLCTLPASSVPEMGTTHCTHITCTRSWQCACAHITCTRSAHCECAHITCSGSWHCGYFCIRFTRQKWVLRMCPHHVYQKLALR